GPKTETNACAVASRPYSTGTCSGGNSRAHNPRTIAMTGGWVTPAATAHPSSAAYGPSAATASAIIDAQYPNDIVSSTRRSPSRPHSRVDSGAHTPTTATYVPTTTPACP